MGSMRTYSSSALLSCLIAILQLNFMLAQLETHIIHMDLSAMPKAFSSHHSWYAAIVSNSIGRGEQVSDTSTSSTSSSHLYSYSHAANGFSARLSPDELKAIQNSPGFVSSFRDVHVTIDTTHTPEFLHLNSIPEGAWAKSNYGKGMIIGVVDTGIWPESDSFKDDGMPLIPSRWKGKCVKGTSFDSSMCNRKLIGARYFNKGILSNTLNLTISMNSARDIEGHGTHTSSIAAGNYVRNASYFGYGEGTARGMAPLAHVAIYKAIWDNDAFASDVLAAIDQAIEDGVDVISLSLGLGRFTLDEDPIAIASFAAMEKGVFFATSAGNKGAAYGSLDKGIPWLLAVGASSMDRELNGIATLDNGDQVIGLSMYPGSSSLEQLPLVFRNQCYLHELHNVRDKIVICKDIDTVLDVQIDRVGNASAAGGIFITNRTYLELYLQLPSYPAIFVTPKDGELMLNYVNSSSNPRATLEFKKTRIGTKPAPLVAAYSSRGPSHSCASVLKPDVMAPGTLILASWTQAIPVVLIKSRPLFSKFNIISGTSMACPHAAGLAALLKSVHPNWSPAAIRSAMMTTADNIDNTNNPIKDSGSRYNVATPLAMGAGQINPNKALDPGLVYDANAEDYVKLLCAMRFTKKQIQIITRSSIWNCSNPSGDLNYPSFIAYFNANHSSPNARVVQEFQRTVTNVGNARSTYKATITPIDGFQVTVMPETLAFDEKYQKLSYKLSIEGPRMMKQVVAHGSLAWNEIGGKYVVRSPIVTTRLSLVD
ncbi:hypothetical protein Syun_015292 [Stephania yunnanensis]|uniref:Subtilisin-like protease SBT1.9 n=1 Tax=Stephania yunnanensis TaxID=152371 RepID=A0AAP0JN87_9MAGN